MDESEDLKTTRALGQKSGVAKSTVDRATRAETTLTIDNFASIAAAFGMKPSELMRQAEQLDQKQQDADWVKPLTRNQKTLHQAATLLAGSIPDSQALALAHMIKASVSTTFKPEHDKDDERPAAKKKPQQKVHS